MALARDASAPTRVGVVNGVPTAFNNALGGLDFSFGTPVPGTAQAARNTAVTPAALTFGGRVPSLDFTPASPVSFPSGTPRSVPRAGSTGFISNFLNTLTVTGGSGRNNPVPINVRGNPASSNPSPAALLGSLTNLPRTGITNPATSTVNTANVDGGSGFLAELRALQDVVSGVTGASDGSGTTPVSIGGGGSQSSGINPLYVVGGALLIGGLYYLTAN